jgi:hypothetical protein
VGLSRFDPAVLPILSAESLMNIWAGPPVAKLLSRRLIGADVGVEFAQRAVGLSRAGILRSRKGLLCDLGWDTDKQSERAGRWPFIFSCMQGTHLGLSFYPSTLRERLVH